MIMLIAYGLNVMVGDRIVVGGRSYLEAGLPPCLLMFHCLFLPVQFDRDGGGGAAGASP